MPYVLDESSFRTDKTVFPDQAEAKQRALEAARILGRPITIFELQNGQLNFCCQMMPDGTTREDWPTANPPPGHAEPQPSPAVLGGVALLDTVASVMEQAGRPDLAAKVDRVAQKRAKAARSRMTPTGKPSFLGPAHKKKLNRVKDDVSEIWRSGRLYEWSNVYHEWVPREPVTIKPNVKVSDLIKKLARDRKVQPKEIGIEVHDF